MPAEGLPSAYSILRQQFEGSMNFMTPNVVEVGKVGPLDAERIVVYEISEGTSMGLLEGSEVEHVPIFGVTFVEYVPSTGETFRGSDTRIAPESQMFESYESAKDYVEELGWVTPETHLDIQEEPVWKEEEYQGWSNWYTWSLTLWAGNEESTYRQIQDNKPFTPESARSLGHDLFPVGTPDMDWPFDMDQVNWTEVAEAWNEE